MKDEDFVYRIIRACGSSTANSDINVFALEKIIEDIKAAEREACAKLCDDEARQSGSDHEAGGMYWCAEKIRAMGKPQRPVKSYTNGEPQYATEDMSTKSQNVYTSEERVHEIDISIHEKTHTDHPMRHWDRTCPACVAESTNSTSNFVESKALAQPEQEPEYKAQSEAVRLNTNGRMRIDPVTGDVSLGAPSKPWVSLTDEECDEIWGECLGVFDCLKMTEAKLKEKNNG